MWTDFNSLGVVKSELKVEDGRARLTVRLYAAETQVLAELEKQGEKPSSLIRTALTRYLHQHYQPIYEEIYAENRRRNEELLKSYYARQAREKAEYRDSQ